MSFMSGNEDLDSTKFAIKFVKFTLHAAPCFWLTLLLSFACATLSAADKPVNLKLGTLAPRGTSYHKSLLSMGEKWRQATGGAVRLTVFPDGTQGGEADMVGL